MLAQLVASPSETVPCLVVAELPAGDDSKPDISARRSAAVPPLEAEIDRAAADQAVEIVVSGECVECEFR